MTPQEVAPLESLLPAQVRSMLWPFPSALGWRGEGAGINMGARLSSLPVEPGRYFRPRHRHVF